MERILAHNYQQMNNPDQGEQFNRRIIEMVVEKFRKRADNENCEQHLEILRRKWIDHLRRLTNYHQETANSRVYSGQGQLIARPAYTGYVQYSNSYSSHLGRRSAPAVNPSQLLCVRSPYQMRPDVIRTPLPMPVIQGPQYRLIPQQIAQRPALPDGPRENIKPDGNQVLKQGIEELMKQQQAPLFLKGKSKQNEKTSPKEKSSKKEPLKELIVKEESKIEEDEALEVESSENYSDESDQDAAFESLEQNQAPLQVKKEENGTRTLVERKNETAADLVSQFVVGGEDAKHEEEKKEGESSESEGVDLDECSDIEIEEFEADDSLVGLFQEVKRTQMKYKCIFVNCILHIRGKDIIVPKMSADIDY